MGRRYLGRDHRSSARHTAWVAAAVLTCALIIALLHAHAYRPFLPLPLKRDPVSRLHGWERLRDLEAHVAKVDKVVCDNYGLAAEVAWQLRHLKRDVSIIALNRDPKPNSGDWLLLEQQGEWGDASLSVTCKRVSKMPDVPLVNPAGKLYDIVKVSIGDNCHTASN